MYFFLLETQKLTAQKHKCERFLTDRKYHIQTNRKCACLFYRKVRIRRRGYFGMLTVLPEVRERDVLSENEKKRISVSV